MLKKQRIEAALCLFIIPLLFLFPLTGCASRANTETVVRELCRGLGIEGSVYFVHCTEGESANTDGTVNAMFLGALPDTDEYSLALSSRLGGGAEIGAFYTDGYDGYLLRTVLRERLDFLESVWDGGEGFLVRSGRLTVYGFVQDASRAAELLRGIL